MHVELALWIAPKLRWAIGSVVHGKKRCVYALYSHLSDPIQERSARDAAKKFAEDIGVTFVEVTIHHRGIFG
jgi:hypothetical protein